MSDAPPTTPSGPLPLGSRGREEAAALMWPWQTPDGEAKRAMAMRRQGTLQALVGYGAATALFALGHGAVAVIAGSLATLTLALAWASPLGAYAGLERGLTAFGRTVGLVVGWVLLTPIFLLFFVPFGLLFRRGDRDPMRRQWDSAMPSYWRERTADEDVLERRQRQF